MEQLLQEWSLRPASRAVPEQPSWELGSCTTATELYREGSSWGKLLAENHGACEVEIMAHISPTWTKSQPMAALKIHFRHHSVFLCTVKEKNQPRYMLISPTTSPPKGASDGRQRDKQQWRKSAHFPLWYSLILGTTESFQFSKLNRYEAAFIFSKANHKNLFCGILW